MLNIKVVGGGCATCQKLEAMCKEVTSEKNIEAEIEKVTDLNKFADLGIFVTPGLIVNDKILSSGKLPTKPTLEKWLAEAAQ